MKLAEEGYYDGVLHKATFTTNTLNSANTPA